MSKQVFSSCGLQLCSRCLNHEINSWIDERWKELNDETRKEILEELKAIKLKQGECVVCKNSLISTDTTERILEILDENKVEGKLKLEFKKYFCFS